MRQLEVDEEVVNTNHSADTKPFPYWSTYAHVTLLDSRRGARESSSYAHLYFGGRHSKSGSLSITSGSTRVRQIGHCGAARLRRYGSTQFA